MNRLYLFVFVCIWGQCLGLSLFASTERLVVAPAPTNSSSTPRKLQNTSEPGMMMISFVNGIYHSLEDWTRITNQLKQTFNAEVRPFYNPSSGNWVGDISAIGYELLRRSDDFIVAKDLARHLREMLEDVGPDGRVYHIAHSGGAILTYLAAKHHLTAGEKARIDIVTFGAGRSLTHKYFKGRVRNYYAKNDPVLIVDKLAYKLYKRFANSLSASVSPYIEVLEPEFNTSYVYLTGLVGNAILDHSMEGPTYGNVLAMEAKDFHERRNKLQQHSGRKSNSVYFRTLRKRMARLTGWHRFWQRRRPTKPLRDYAKLTANLPAVIASYPASNAQLTTNALRKFRKTVARLTGWHQAFGRKPVLVIPGNASSVTNGTALLLPPPLPLHPQDPSFLHLDSSSAPPLSREDSASPVSLLSDSPGEDAEYFVYSPEAGNGRWLALLGEGSRRLYHWSAPARSYAAEMVTTTLPRLVLAAAANLTASVSGGTAVGNETQLRAINVEPVASFELNLTATGEVPVLPAAVKLLLFNIAHLRYSQQLSSAAAADNISSPVAVPIVSVEASLAHCCRMAQLARLLAAHESPAVDERMAYLAGTLHDAWAFEAHLNETAGDSGADNRRSDARPGLLKTLRMVPDFLTSTESELLVRAVQRLSGVTLSDSNDGDEAVRIANCVTDAMHLSTTSLADVLREKRAGVSSGGSDSVDASWEPVTATGRLLWEQRQRLTEELRRARRLDETLLKRCTDDDNFSDEL